MIHILNEVPGDAPAIHAVNAAAFPTEAEAMLVDALRTNAALTVSLVADEDSNIIGHIAASPVDIGSTATAEGWYGIGPVAVIPERQGEGIGERLVAEALRVLRDLHAARGAVVLGDPAYYSRFGFAASDLTFEELPLQAISFSGDIPTGRVRYHDSFHDL